MENILMSTVSREMGEQDQRGDQGNEGQEGAGGHYGRHGIGPSGGFDGELGGREHCDFSQAHGDIMGDIEGMTC